MSLDTIVAKARLIPGDYGESFTYSDTAGGGRTRFDLPEENVDSATLVVTVNGTAVVPPDYTLEPRTGVLTFATAPANGAAVVVTGMANTASLTGDIQSFAEIAFDLHIRGRDPAPTMDTLSPVEEYLVALLTVIENLWAQVAAAAQEVDVTTPEGMHIPAGQRFQQLMALLEQLQAHYLQLSQALNVGPYAIQMFTLRRVSLTTNRLVPVYRAQEFDDHSTPVRVYPPIPTGEL